VSSFFGHSVVWLRRQIDDLLDVVYPPVCGICGRPAESGERLICEKCWEAVKGLEMPYCSGCKQFLPETLRCPECRPAPLVVFSLGYFDGPLKTIIHDLKFHGLKPLGAGLGRRLAEVLSSRADKLAIDFIIPVPLHISRYYARGFNQAEEIAREIGRRLDLAVRADLLYAARKTKQQAKLPAAQREINVRGAFAVPDRAEEILNGATILLVDDVTTTGATLREAARVLREATARRVVAAVAATAL